MRHTAKSLATSPNPDVLELRILANHANDARFSFLRGRYTNTWERLKEANRRAKTIKPVSKIAECKAVGALVGGYDSSDSDEDLPSPPGSPPPPPPEDGANLADTVNDRPVPNATEGIEEEKQRERRRRAQDWKRKRAEEKSQ